MNSVKLLWTKVWDIFLFDFQNFNELVPPFLPYRNVPKKFYELLRPIPTHTERPHIFKKNVIGLPSIVKLFEIVYFYLPVKFDVLG